VLRLAASVAAIGFVLKLLAAQSAGWFLVPLAAAACAWHIYAHSVATRAPVPPRGLAMGSNVALAAALILQLDYTPGYNCAWDTLSGAAYRLGLTAEMACTWWAGWPSVLLDLLFYVPAAVTWFLLQATTNRRPA